LQYLQRGAVDTMISPQLGQGKKDSCDSDSIIVVYIARPYNV
jgi:hypothetical protein